MATGTNNEELRQQALNSLAEGRTETSAEMHWLRMQLSPSRVLRRVVDRHTGLTLIIAFAAGLVPVLLFFRGKGSRHLEQRPVTVRAVRPEPKPTVSALLLGVLARTITPALVKSAIVSPLLNFLTKKQPDAVQSKPPD